MNIAKLVLVASLLTIAIGSPARSQDLMAKAQPTPPVATKPTQSRSEVKYYTITLTQARVFVHVPDGMKFLEDPVGTLRRNRITVLSGADVHWKKLAAALHRLAKPQIPPRSTPLLHKALVNNQVVQLQIPNGWIPVAGDWNGDGTITGADFLRDPVGTLYAQGLRVAVADADSWREVADALKALRRAYAKPSATLNRQNSNQSELTSAPTQSSQGSVIIYNVYTSGATSSQVVGNCNTTQGCKILKNVCETLPKHAFATNQEGSLGVCADTTRRSGTGAWFLRNSNSAGGTSNEGGNNEVIKRRPGTNQAQGKPQHPEIRISKEWDVASPALNCEGAAICRKVQNTCATLGGTYKRINDVSGSCRH